MRSFVLRDVRTGHSTREGGVGRRAMRRAAPLMTLRTAPPNVRRRWNWTPRQARRVRPDELAVRHLTGDELGWIATSVGVVRRRIAPIGDADLIDRRTGTDAENLVRVHHPTGSSPGRSTSSIATTIDRPAAKGATAGLHLPADVGQRGAPSCDHVHFDDLVAHADALHPPAGKVGGDLLDRARGQASDRIASENGGGDGIGVNRGHWTRGSIVLGLRRGRRR